MQDFKFTFELEEKAPDYLREAGIVQVDSGANRLDSSKYVREMLSTYDVDSAVWAPMPVNTIVYMPADDDDSNDKRTNLGLFQQITGSIICTAICRTLSSSSTRLNSAKSWEGPRRSEWVWHVECLCTQKELSTTNWPLGQRDVTVSQKPTYPFFPSQIAARHVPLTRSDLTDANFSCLEEQLSRGAANRKNPSC